VNQVAEVLVEITSKHNFFQLDAEQLEYIYRVALKRRNIKDKKKLLNNIIDFHSFMVLSRLAPKLDWSGHYHYVRSNRVASSVDAGFITPKEYEQALMVIESFHDKDAVSDRLSQLYSAIVICGYRFGLRISEVEHLRYKDIQYKHDWSFVVLNVCNTYFDDTKSPAGRRQVPLIGKLSSNEKRILKNVFTPSNIVELDPNAAVFTEDDSTRDLFDTAKASYVINNVLKQVTGDDGAHSHWLRHSYPSRIYPKYYSNQDDWYGEVVEKLSGQYIDDVKDLRKLMTGRTFPSHWDIKSLSVALGHADVSTTFSNYIHTADVHMRYCLGMKEYWNFGVKCVDHISSYLVPDAKFEALKKKRVRNGIGSKDLIGAFDLIADNGKFYKSNIITRPHPSDEKIGFELNEGVLSNEVTLQQIDDIILLSIIGDETNVQEISERLFININVVDKVLLVFKKQQEISGYRGYQSQLPLNIFDSSQYDYESSAETLSLRTLLIDLSKLISSISEEHKQLIKEGVSVWSECYYPNPHFRQLIFDNPAHLVKFLDAVNILSVASTEMQITALKPTGTWYKIVSEKGINRLVVFCDGIGDREYQFDKSKITPEIPRSSPKGKFQNKERVSVSLSRHSNHQVHYPKRLHRLLFLVSIWINMVDS
jgi:integrase